MLTLLILAKLSAKQAYMYLLNAYRSSLLCKFIKAAFTQQRFFMNMVTLVFIFTEEVQRLHIVVLSAEVNYACGMWAWHFGKHSKFSTMNCRKCNFVLIDVKIGLSLIFLASMKAKVHLYQKYVSVFWCLHVKS